VIELLVFRVGGFDAIIDEKRFHGKASIERLVREPKRISNPFGVVRFKNECELHTGSGIAVRGTCNFSVVVTSRIMTVRFAALSPQFVRHTEIRQSLRQGSDF
jgi:hypothetical protein